MKDQDSCSTPKTPTDHATSGENLETSGRMEKEETKEADKKGKSEELSAEESPEKMEVDHRDSPSNEEQSMTEFTLVSESIILDLLSKIMHYNS